MYIARIGLMIYMYMYFEHLISFNYKIKIFFSFSVGIHGSKGAKIANHTARKTLVKTLKKAGTDAATVAQITGWKDPNSIKSYHELDKDEHKEVSHVLSNYTNKDMSLTKDTPLDTSNTLVSCESASSKLVPASSYSMMRSSAMSATVSNVAESMPTAVFNNATIYGGFFTFNAPPSSAMQFSKSKHFSLSQ